MIVSPPSSVSGLCTRLPISGARTICPDISRSASHCYCTIQLLEFFAKKIITSCEFQNRSVALVQYAMPFIPCDSGAHVISNFYLCIHESYICSFHYISQIVVVKIRSMCVLFLGPIRNTHTSHTHQVKKESMCTSDDRNASQPRLIRLQWTKDRNISNDDYDTITQYCLFGTKFG